MKNTDVQEPLRNPAIRIPRRPSTSYPPELPITARKDEIADLLRRHQVVVVTGETGSGKSTQLPKICLDAGRGSHGMIGCTQPRRLAAVTVARRVAEELGEEIGMSVAYKIRFDERSGDRSCIKFMTDGVLLMEAQRDRFLRRYDTLIVDEAHERTLNIDFIIGLLRSILPRRRDLKVIITSATLETERFSQAFHNAPVIHISGRLYPVEIRWQPLAAEDEGEGPPSYVEGAAAAVADLDRNHHHGDSGDILIFMPTEQDIRETCELLGGRFQEGKTVLPLFSRLSAGEQQRVFQPSSRQKIVVATNVAETSLTIPNIRYVIDTGLARVAQYNPRTRSTALPVVPVSRSSADQRMGRCGRVRDGVCIRLYDREDYLSRPLFTPPEIVRANLAAVVLRMLYLNIGDVFSFPFLDPPAKRQLKDALDILRELGAISRVGNPELTATGRFMALLPVDPRFARMLIAAAESGCLEEMLVIAAALSILDPRERPQDKLAEAERMHVRFQDPSSDFVGILKLWQALHREVEGGPTGGRLRKFCRIHYLSWRRMREWQDLHRQLKGIIREALPDPAAAKGTSDSETAALYLPQPVSSRDNVGKAHREDPYAGLHKAILSGFLSGIATKNERNLYRAPKGKTAMIFPGSGLFRRGGTWIVAAEWVETTRLYARTVASIEPEWIVEVAGELCSFAYSDPFWNRERGEVQAWEQISLYGLVIIPRRTVSYGKIAPDVAMEIFLREGIMTGELKGEYPFLIHNREVIERVRCLEDKVRAPGIFFDEERVFDFYRKRLPQLSSERALRHHIRRQGDDAFLFMKNEDILTRAPEPELLTSWPDEASVLGINVPLTYNFHPGKDDDGITARIPFTLLASPDCFHLETAVPGLLRKKLHELLRRLPKAYRRLLPAGMETAETLLRHLPKVQAQASLSEALTMVILNNYGVTIPPTAWPLAELPDFLKMRFVVTDENGRELENSRDLGGLHTRFHAQAIDDYLEQARRQWEIAVVEQGDFPELPDAVPLGEGGMTVAWAYPALKVEAGAVSMRLFQERDMAEKSHRQGVAALFERHFSTELKYLRKALLPEGKMKLHAERFSGVKQFQKRAYDKVIHDLFAVNIRNRNSFYTHADNVKPLILPRGQEIMQLAAPVLSAHFETSEVIKRLENRHRREKPAQEYLQLLTRELKELLPEDFLVRYPERIYDHLRRYLRGLAIRAERGMFDIARAFSKTAEINYYRDQWKRIVGAADRIISSKGLEEHEEFRWLLEEYKISIFAQELKTSTPVSPKRLEKKLETLRDMLSS
ncbi:MAG: ATP-dependent RNA helicase HrpA [Syntrophobacterales bacterium]|nr:ATP-dependent RNA helicase HrpA [Syntrophobacterales bacterium]